MTAVLFALLFASAILFPLLLYVAIENETNDPQIMDRAEAERRAQRTSGVDQSHLRERADGSSGGQNGDSDDGRSGDDHWGYSRLEDERE